MRYKSLIILCFCTCLNLSAQEDENTAPLQQQNIDTDEKLKTKLGVSCTFGGHQFIGTAFDNERPLYGFGVGMYNIIDLSKNKKVKLQWEFNLTFKGSKFAKPNDTSFSRISITYAEIPVYLSFQMTENAKPLHFMMGGQFGYMFKSSVTQGYGQFADIKTTNLPFRKIDFCPALALRKELGSGISVQLAAKYGLINIYTDKFDPVTNPQYLGFYPKFKDGSHDVHNMSFELSFLF